MRPVLALLVALCLMPAMAPASDVAEGPGVWRLIALNGEGPPDVVVTLAFPEPGRLAGQGPCNRYSGSVTGTAPAFRAGPVMATRMACPALEFESRYFAALSQVDRIETDGVRMALTGPGTVLEYATPLD
ncbi:MAG: META domain-containing protein [Paracoccaceae bacterium]|nr:MAG: META domain-containing protein [Paracoccaceae bacterium]